jgi:hypothetical protein
MFPLAFKTPEEHRDYSGRDEAMKMPPEAGLTRAGPALHARRDQAAALTSTAASPDSIGVVE